MKTLRMAAAAALAFTLMACGGVPPPSEPAPAPSADSEVSAQGCTLYYRCDGSNSVFTSDSACASYCPDGAAGCDGQTLCCYGNRCEWH
jgi:hypothetical protein